MESLDKESLSKIKERDYNDGFNDGYRARLPRQHGEAYVRGYDAGFGIDFGDTRIRMLGKTVGEILTEEFNKVRFFY